MARVIGYVKTMQQGTFYARDKEGHVRELKAGDPIREGEVVYGATSNTKEAQIVIDMVGESADNIVLAGNSALYFDATLLAGVLGIEDAVIDSETLGNAWAQTTDTPINLDKLEGETETAAGQQTTTDGTRIGDAFDSRTGGLGDVSADLRGIIDGQTIIAQQDIFRPLVLGGVNGNTDIKADIVISDAGSVKEADGAFLTYTVKLSNAVASDVAVNLNTTGTATAGSDYNSTLQYKDASGNWQNVTGAITLPADASAVEVRVAVKDDTITESDETVVLGATTTSTYVNNASDTGTGTITDEGTGNYGPEDTVTLKVVAVNASGAIIGDGTTNSGAEGGNTYYKVIALAPNGTEISGATGSVNIAFTPGTAIATLDYTTTVTTVNIGQVFSATLVDDTLDENNETFSVSLVSNTISGMGVYENVVTSTSTVTTTIIDNDLAPLVSNVASDDDYVKVNTDTNLTNNIVQTGTIQNVGATDVVTLSGNTSITSNNKSVNYVWDATTKTLTASTTDGTVFTVKVNSNNTGYTFTQLMAIDHTPTVQGEADSKVLNFGLSVTGGISTASFDVTVLDDAPTVTGTKSITTQNDGNYTESGFLTQATLSNDVTKVVWNTSALPNLVYEGKTVYYVDLGNGTLEGRTTSTDASTAVFRVSIDPTIVDVNNSPKYTFDLLNTLGQLGVEGTASVYTVISGGNIANLDLAFGNYLIDSMTATSSTGAVATVNTNNNWIGVDGNWFNTGDTLKMAFTDPSGDFGQVRGMDMMVEGQGSAAYTLTWKVTAAINAAGDTITYTDTVSGTGNTNLPFSIPLKNGAIYFTSLEISDNSAGDFRISFSAVTANNYFSDLPINFGYTLQDADGDTATGAINVTLTPPVLPTTNDTTASANEDTAVAITLSGADTDGTISGYKINELPLNGTLYKDAAMTQAITVGEKVTVNTVYFKPSTNWNGTTTFKYAAVDNDGNVDLSPATATITIAPVNDSPVFGNTTSTANVSEEGLTGGVADTTGSVDTTNATVATGTFNITDVDSTIASVTLGTPTVALTSNGQAITWTGVGTSSLIGSAGGKEIINISITNTGAYTVTLKGPVDHAIAGVEDVKSFNVGVSASDGSLTASGTLTINIEDDAPMTMNASQSFSVGQQDTNLMIILDVSGSMTSGTIDRLAAAKTAISNLINTYDGYGDVAVKIITFSTIAQDTSGVWMSASDALAMLNGITASGYTNYDAALAQAIDSWGGAGRFTEAPTGGKIQNVAYFLSDGKPNESDDNTSLLLNSSGSRVSTTITADSGIQIAEEALWKTFLEGNQIKSYAFGIGDGLVAADMAYLDPIAYDGITKTDTSSTWVKDVNNLSNVLQATVAPIAQGNILTGATPGAVGADGGYVNSISVGPIGDVRTFTWDKVANTITATGTGGSTYTFDTTTHVLNITTEQGGTGIVDLDDGNYTYTPSASMTGTITEIFGFTLKDNDGDMSSGQITMNITRDSGSFQITGTTVSETLTGTANDDILSGLGGNDIIYGLGGNDWLSGGSGSDKLFGGDGNDTLVTDLKTDSITGTILYGDIGLGNLDGGAGIDTLMLSDNNSVINFAALDSTNNPIKNIEIIDLGHGKTSDSHTLNNLSLQDVLDMTDANKTLKILGDANDTVDFANGTGTDMWTKTANASTEVINGTTHTFDHYTNSKDTSVLVKVETTITDTI